MYTSILNVSIARELISEVLPESFAPQLEIEELSEHKVIGCLRRIPSSEASVYEAALSDRGLKWTSLVADVHSHIVYYKKMTPSVRHGVRLEMRDLGLEEPPLTLTEHVELATLYNVDRETQQLFVEQVLLAIREQGLPAAFADVSPEGGYRPHVYIEPEPTDALTKKKTGRVVTAVFKNAPNASIHGSEVPEGWHWDVYPIDEAEALRVLNYLAYPRQKFTSVDQIPEDVPFEYSREKQLLTMVTEEVDNLLQEQVSMSDEEFWSLVDKCRQAGGWKDVIPDARGKEFESKFMDLYDGMLPFLEQDDTVGYEGAWEELNISDDGIDYAIMGTIWSGREAYEGAHRDLTDWVQKANSGYWEENDLGTPHKEEWGEGVQEQLPILGPFNNEQAGEGHTHSECVNYEPLPNRQGWGKCKLKGSEIEGSAPACPSFNAVGEGVEEQDDKRPLTDEEAHEIIWTTIEHNAEDMRDWASEFKDYTVEHLKDILIRDNPGQDLSEEDFSQLARKWKEWIDYQSSAPEEDLTEQIRSVEMTVRGLSEEDAELLLPGMKEIPVEMKLVRDWVEDNWGKGDDIAPDKTLTQEVDVSLLYDFLTGPGIDVNEFTMSPPPARIASSEDLDQYFKTLSGERPTVPSVPERPPVAQTTAPAPGATTGGAPKEGETAAHCPTCGYGVELTPTPEDVKKGTTSAWCPTCKRQQDFKLESVQEQDDIPYDPMDDPHDPGYEQEEPGGKPPVELVGQDGNAFAILGKCQRAARTAGWDADRIKKFMDEATSGDYDHLLQTVMKHFDVDGGEDVEEQDYDQEWVVISQDRSYTSDPMSKDEATGLKAELEAEGVTSIMVPAEKADEIKARAPQHEDE